MAAIVSVDCESGALSRYEIGGESWRLTHRAIPVDGVDALTKAAIEGFRVDPNPDFAVEPPPKPTDPPAGSGSIYPCDVEAA